MMATVRVIMHYVTLVFLLFLYQNPTTVAHNLSNFSFYYDGAQAIAEERDALYPIARYAGMGYNLLRGNPEGDFDSGGKDPGIHDTRWIFNLTYSSKREGYYKGKTVAVPDQVEFQPSQSCSLSSSTKAYSGQRSYQKELKRSVNLGLSGGFANLANLGFSLSGGMKKVQTKTADNRQVIIQKTKLCNLVGVRYKEELSNENPLYVLSRGFKNAIKGLPEVFESENQASKQAYLKFIERWGTHVIVSVELGTREMERQSASYSEVYNFLSKQKSGGGSLNAGVVVKGIGVSGNIGINVDKLNSNIKQNTRIGNKHTKVTIGSSSSPAPIKFLELTPISEVIEERLWGESWDNDRVDMRQRSLKRALNMYPKLTNASIQNDPYVTIHTTLSWLSDTFALPAPSSGCPEGFHGGSIKQDTHNNIFRKNSWSYGIKERLKVDVHSKYITTHFCVKTDRNLEKEIPWPKGSYCIARKGDHCPEGFSNSGSAADPNSEGYIKWDDKDISNKNEQTGVLPDGKFDKNTKIYFCCRDDAKPSKPISMPIDEPFVLYRYGGECQTIANMRVEKDFILWCNELHFNKDERNGAYPDDDGGKRKHKLHYCHYTPKD